MTMTDTLKNATTGAAEHLQQTTREMGQDADRAIREAVDTTAARVGKESNRYVRTLGAAIGEGARHLREEGYDMSADTMDDVASLLSRSAAKISRERPADLGRTLVDAMREHPLLTCGLLAGASYALVSLLQRADIGDPSLADEESDYARGFDRSRAGSSVGPNYSADQ
ncbi:MAG: hypothetical protein R3E83_15345 [Burkholderiaceae bacterium]